VIYLDNNATTPVDKRAIDRMLPYFSELFGNASSLHQMGFVAREALDKAREEISQIFNVSPNEIYFTSGATEGINWALKGVALALRRGTKKVIVTTKTEHKAVLNTVRQLEIFNNCCVKYCRVNSSGLVDIENLVDIISPGTMLVSLTVVNGETGVIQPVDDVISAIRKKNSQAIIHLDAAQVIGKMPFERIWDCDIATFSAHKFHGPKGLGITYIKRGTPIYPLLAGGGQERGMRSGTENVPLIVATAEALKATVSDLNRSLKLFKKWRSKLSSAIADLDGVIISPEKNSVLNTLTVAFPGIPGSVLVNALSAKGICISTGSACQSRSVNASHVLKAMGVAKNVAEAAVRISTSKMNKDEEIESFIEVLTDIVSSLHRR